jgi:hypothetical protein
MYRKVKVRRAAGEVWTSPDIIENYYYLVRDPRGLACSSFPIPLPSHEARCRPSLPAVADQKRRAFWLKHLHQWHWISSGICLVAMLVFAATGLTLNHAAQIEAKPQVTHRKALLPESLLAPLRPGGSGRCQGRQQGRAAACRARLGRP